MHIIIIGSTGFIGRELVALLPPPQFRVTGITRDISRARQVLGDRIRLAGWDGRTAESLSEIISGSDAVINLAGENIAAGRWSNEKKQRLRNSRIRTGNLLAKAVRMASPKPSVLIQGSATGYYGVNVNEPSGESAPAGTGFLAELTRDWESSVEPLKTELRLVLIRTGIVLGAGGGMLGKLMLPFRFCSGTVMGPGNQWVPWIHLRDEARAIRFLLEHENCSGPYNLVSPEAVRMQDFIHTMAGIIGKPAWVRIPAFVLRTFLGQMAEETILASQQIIPAKLAEAGFSFDYPELSGALKNLLTSK